jgi:cystathionine beta-synthase
MLIEDPSAASKPVHLVMDKPFPVVPSDTGVERISKLFNKTTSAVLVKNEGGPYDIITKSDLIQALSQIGSDN